MIDAPCRLVTLPPYHPVTLSLCQLVPLSNMIFAFDDTVWRAAAERAVLFVPNLATAIVLFVVFWLVARGVAGLILRAGAARKVSSDALFVLSRAVKLALFAVGVVTALGTLG